MISLGYTFKNSLHYYDNEEGMEDNGENRQRDSLELQDFMAQWKRDIAPSVEETKEFIVKYGEAKNG